MGWPPNGPPVARRASWQASETGYDHLLAERDRATDWVRSAIRSGQCRFSPSDQNFPKRIWYEDDGQFWQGLKVNDGLGEYKGWPISKEKKDEVFG